MLASVCIHGIEPNLFGLLPGEKAVSIDTHHDVQINAISAPYHPYSIPGGRFCGLVLLCNADPQHHNLGYKKQALIRS